MDRPVYTPKLPNQTLDEPKVRGSRRKRRVGGGSILEDLGSQLSLAAPELLIADAPLRSFGCFNLVLGERHGCVQKIQALCQLPLFRIEGGECIAWAAIDSNAACGRAPLGARFRERLLGCSSLGLQLRESLTPIGRRRRLLRSQNLHWSVLPLGNKKIALNHIHDRIPAARACVLAADRWRLHHP